MFCKCRRQFEIEMLQKLAHCCALPCLQNAGKAKKLHVFPVTAGPKKRVGRMGNNFFPKNIFMQLKK
jgi:hypothetical protein